MSVLGILIETLSTRADAQNPVRSEHLARIKMHAVHIA
jgi:hypothetical protein